MCAPWCGCQCIVHTILYELMYREIWYSVCSDMSYGRCRQHLVVLCGRSVLNIGIVVRCVADGLTVTTKNTLIQTT